MIKVTLEFDTAAEASAFLADFDSEAEGAAGAGNGEQKKRGRGRPPKNPAADVATQGAAGVAASQPGATAPTPAAQATAPAAVPYKDVADAITAYSEADYPGAVALLGQFGAKTARDLKPEQFAAFVAAANEKLAAAKKPAAPTSLI